MPRPYSEMPDEQLMQAYVQGDAAAFDALYARHEGPLYRFVRRLLGQALAALADEVFQDCWLRIVQSRERFAPELGHWKTWAFAIAHNLALDRLRVAGRELSVDAMAAHLGANAGDGAGDAIGDAFGDALGALQAGGNTGAMQASAEDLAHWRAAGKQLLHCLGELPSEQRAAFLLHHEDGCSLGEMAQALNLGFETAKSRLRYALQKLRQCMQGYLLWGPSA